MKRLFDILVSATLLILLGPLLVLVAIAVRLTSPGPALFRHARVGRRLKPFSMFKFRSMVANAAEIGPYHTDAGDPRITRLGGFLRRTSLDELPQLLNVLRGDMSLVGPRPDVPEQMALLYTEEERVLRHSVRPGMTGLAQVRGRNESTGEQRKRHDLDYARNRSLLMDLRILFATAWQLVFRRSY